MEGKENKKNGLNWLLVVITVVLFCVVAFCAYKIGEAGRKTIDDENTPKGGNSRIVIGDNTTNPWTEVDTLDEAKKTLGFTIGVPAKIDELLMSETVRVSEDLKMIEVRYVDDENTEDKVTIRKAPKATLTADDNFSGVYDTFASTKTVDGVELSLNDNLVYLAEWEKDNYHYSIYFVDGMKEEAALKIVKEIK